MDKIFIENLRLIELDMVAELLPPPSTLLEIGAGAGWQAKQLQLRGFKVSAVDIEPLTDSHYNYEDDRVFEIVQYDGYSLPFPDGSFDVVFSSNVLEHIPHVESFQKEILRVLKDKGTCVHVLPTSYWRFWSMLTYYPALIRNRLKVKIRNDENSGGVIGNIQRKIGISLVIQKLVAPRHGETGNTIIELYLFSALRWKRLFQRTGWVTTGYSTNKLFYTGEQLFGAKIPIPFRRYLSYLLGSSCHFFVLSKDLTLK